VPDRFYDLGLGGPGLGVHACALRSPGSRGGIRRRSGQGLSRNLRNTHRRLTLPVPGLPPRPYGAGLRSSADHPRAGSNHHRYVMTTAAEPFPYRAERLVRRQPDNRCRSFRKFLGPQLFPARRCHLPLPTNVEDRFGTTFRCPPSRQKPFQAIATRLATPFNPDSPTTVRAA
jgi:hypothetical protein